MDRVMNADTLLYWLTDRRSGSWQQFKDAVAVLGGDRPAVTSYVLSSFAYADFSFDTRARWTISAPTLFGMTGQHDAAVFVGARTPQMLEQLLHLSERCGINVAIESAKDSPQRVVLRGEKPAFDRVASELSIGVVHEPLLYYATAVRPIWKLIKDRKSEARPINWGARHFDFATFTWKDGVKPGAACEFTSSYDVKRYCFHSARNKFIPMSRHQAVYAAAAARGVSLLSYSATAATMLVPVKTPLPVDYARWATLMSLDTPTVDSAYLRYSITDCTAVQTLMAYLGQPLPIISK